MSRLSATLCAAIAALALVAVPVSAQAQPIDSGMAAPAARDTLTVATVDAQLSASEDGSLAVSLESGDNPQAKALASAVQDARPDVLVLTGMDVDPAGDSVAALRENYLAEGQGQAGGITYPYVFAAETNAGAVSGSDLDGDGTIGGAGDSFGYGDFEGQNSMVVLSRHPIDTSSARTFTSLLWADVPGNSLGRAGYTKLAAGSIPLESTSVWDLPVDVNGTTVHVIATSATHAEGQAGSSEPRHNDQLRFLSEYVGGSRALSSVNDDQGRNGAMTAGERFVVAGDLGADAGQNNAGSAAVRSLTQDPSVTSVVPTWGAGVPTADDFWGEGLRRMLVASSQATRTGDLFGRYDYVLPSKTVDAVASGLAQASPDGAQSTRLAWITVGF